MKRKLLKQKVYKNEVSSPELSLELKNLGIPQSAALYYWRSAGSKWILFQRGIVKKRTEHYIAALTATQLSEVLKGYEYPYFKSGKFYCKDYLNNGDDINLETDRELEARTKMFIMLIKAKQITIFKNLFCYFENS